MAKLGDKVEDLAEALIIAAIVVGTIATRMFLDVTTNLTTGNAAAGAVNLSVTQALAWGAILTLAMAGLAIGFVRHMRGKKR